MRTINIFKSFKLSIFFLFLNVSLVAQNEVSKWYFGHYAGLDFSTNPPTVLNNSSMNTMDGCSSISDASGNLLFYTNGVTVWDKTHQVMANGTGLLGNFSSTQSALIIKKPGSSSLYYIFTVYYYSFAYSIVDIGLAAGNGSITIKNVLLPAWPGEKLTAAKHCNGTDVWVIMLGNGFNAFHLSSTGIDTNAVTTWIGGSYYFPSLNGTIKASPNARKIAHANYTGGLELYDFDNSTGVLSNLITIKDGFNNEMIYGCEFSPDGTKLYAAGYNPNVIYQWNLCAGADSASIVSSQYTIASSPATSQLLTLQSALNGKIYIARASAKTLAVINNPNALGINCNYMDTAQSVAPNICNNGLPNFLTSFFEKKPSTLSFTFDISKSCLTSTFSPPAALTCPSSGYNLSGLTWLFGDVSSGSANTSTLLTPTHTFSKPGNYTVTLLANYNCSSDTYTQVVSIGTNLQLHPIPQSSICLGEFVAINVAGADTYLWSNNSTATQVVVSPTSTSSYSVTGTTNAMNCSNSDSILITVMPCTGLNGYDNSPAFIKVSPNPSSGILYVNTRIPAKLYVYNAMGEIIFGPEPVNGDHKIDLKEFPPAVYNLIFQTNVSSHSIKVIKAE
jgi:hypothetical protein